jgi:hypothetical protein
MTTIRTADNHPRCQDAEVDAEKTYNFYRCGGARCLSTTADTSDFDIKTLTPTRNVNAGVIVTNDPNNPAFDATYSVPQNACNTIGGKRVNVVTFDNFSGPDHGFRSITVGLPGADAQGWVTLVTNGVENGDAVLTAMQNDYNTNGCPGNDTPLADAMCGVLPLGNKALFSQKMKIFTDGGENSSVGTCSGPEDNTSTMPPFQVGSWQQKTLASIGTTVIWDIDPTLLLPANTIHGPGGSNAIDPETGRPFAHGPTQDAIFFQAVAATSGGKATLVQDNDPISPIVSGFPTPAMPPVALGALAGLLGLVGARVLRRRPVA